jgi:hypothetical protein
LTGALEATALATAAFAGAAYWECVSMEMENSEHTLAATFLTAFLTGATFFGEALTFLTALATIAVV